MTPLTPAVEERLAAVFLPEERAEAARLLVEQCGANLRLMPSDPPGLDRIRFAVLKLSNGNLRSLREYIELAQKDWRDALMAAGFGEDVSAHLYWSPHRD